MMGVGEPMASCLNTKKLEPTAWASRRRDEQVGLNLSRQNTKCSVTVRKEYIAYQALHDVDLEVKEGKCRRSTDPILLCRQAPDLCAIRDEQRPRGDQLRGRL